MHRDKDGFSQVSLQEMHRFVALSHDNQLVLWCLAKNSDVFNRCFLSQKEISEETGILRPNVSRAIKHLSTMENPCIKVYKGKNYFLVDPNIFWKHKTSIRHYAIEKWFKDDGGEVCD